MLAKKVDLRYMGLVGERLTLLFILSASVLLIVKFSADLIKQFSQAVIWSRSHAPMSIIHLEKSKFDIWFPGRAGFKWFSVKQPGYRYVDLQ